VIRLRHLSSAAALVLLACGENNPAGIPGGQIEEWEAHPLGTKARFVSVRDMALTRSYLWVLDAAPPYVTRVTLETGEILQFGWKGKGPGEFVDPWAIQPASASDTSGIIIWDFGSSRVTEFGFSGTSLGSTEFAQAGRPTIRPDFREVSYADPFRVRKTTRGVFSVSFEHRPDRTSDLRMGTLRLSTLVLDPGRPVARLSDFVRTDSDGLKEWAAVPLWDTCGEDLVFWSPVSNEVLWFGQALEPRARTVLSLPSHPTELEDVEAYLERMARLELGPDYQSDGIDLRSMAQGMRDRFSSERPLLTDLRCQGPALAFGRRFGTEDDPLGRGQEWIAINEDGPFRHIRVPSGSTPFLFTSEGSIGTMILSDTDQVIARIVPPSRAISNSP